MSYDLYFYVPEGESLHPQSLQEWVDGQPPLYTVHRGPEHSLEIEYANEDTDVGFGLSFRQRGPAEDEGLPRFPQFRSSGLAFNINFGRPSFYIEEALPALESLTKKLSLLVVDPQTDDPKAAGYAPHPLDVRTVRAAWKAGNAAATQAFATQRGQSPLHIPPERMMAWWAYQRGRPDLQKKMGEAVFVPSLRVFYHEEKKAPVFVTAWTDGIATVFPPADLILLVRQRRKLLGLMKSLETGSVEAGPFLQKLAAWLKPVEGTPGLSALSPDDAHQVKPIFWSEPIDTNMEPLRGLSMMECTDVALEEPDNKARR